MLSISKGTPEIGLCSHPNNLCGPPNKAGIDRHKKKEEPLIEDIRGASWALKGGIAN